ncbi:unnamed protein product [Cylindrotheca closterium]|uniref:Uncharacterized protein n=1 Tax=Cylindrotheca closterium TaxID=2856 RepID=A0AAD2PU42_9STRA|nr:unnamed protein product [Cylindrotheca closterium]
MQVNQERTFVLAVILAVLVAYNLRSYNKILQTFQKVSNKEDHQQLAGTSGSIVADRNSSQEIPQPPSNSSNRSIGKHPNSPQNPSSAVGLTQRTTSNSSSNSRTLDDGLSFATPTGIASKWEYLTEDLLEEYFTPAEIKGMATKECGDVMDPQNPWQWQGQAKRRISSTSGPCCPNGHIYGWFGINLMDTSPY